jgi:hypothetical protein
MAVRIQLRRDTASNWTSNNPILAQGEIGYDLTNNNFKVGDGTTAWSSLLYYKSVETDPVFTASAANGIESQDITNWDTAYGWGDHAQAGYLLSSTAATTYQPAGDYATLTNGLISTDVLPALAITNTFTVIDESAMLALEAQTGDVAIRTDINKTFILADNDSTVLANWKEILTPADGVTSVDISVPQGLLVTSNPITSTGILTITYTEGYSIPTNSSQTNWDTAYNHSSLTNNPHSVTAEQVGLGNVQNLGIATNEEALAGEVNDKYMTPNKTLAAISDVGGSGLLWDNENKEYNLDYANNTETTTGTSTTKVLTPGVIQYMVIDGGEF